MKVFNSSAHPVLHGWQRLLPLLSIALVGVLVLWPAPVWAAVTSNVAAGVLTVNSDADDAITIGCAGGNVTVNSADPGSGAATCATITTITVGGGPGDNTIDLSGVTSADFTTLTSVTVNADNGRDTVTGTPLVDTLNGDDGNDTLIGAKGDDTMSGGPGDDTLIWNNGDNSDTIDGDAGNDTTQVNGAPAGDLFEIGPNGSRVTFTRTNLISFTLDISTENLEANGLDGDDVMTGTAGLAGLITITLNGGNGNDIITGGDGNDTLIGAPGDDTMSGGPGDDTLIWNNGDNSDTMDGDAGNDTTQVNGAPAGDLFEIGPNGSRVTFTRTNLISFTLDISTENLEANGLDGDDVMTGTAGLAGLITITLNGGNGNDIITGGDGNDTLIGAPGDDTMSGGPGDDTLIWNNGDNSDTIDGDGGNDTTQVNGAPVGDLFEIGPNGTTRVTFTRTNLIPFTLDISTENLEANGLDGDDVMTGTVGLASLITLTLSGGNGNDIITGGDGKDTLNGDDGNDTLIGAKGDDTMSGGPGDDTLIWNNGDNSDTIDGDAGNDTTQVNGAPLGDLFEIGSNGARVALTRTNLISFTLDILAERLEVNGLDGDDVFDVIPLPSTVLFIDGGPPSSSDSMTVDAQNQLVTVFGQTISVAGAQPITHVFVETVTIVNQSHGLFLPTILRQDVY